SITPVASCQWSVASWWLSAAGHQLPAVSGTQRRRSPGLTGNWQPATDNCFSLLDRNLTQQLEVREHLARAQHHAAQRVVGDRNRQSRFLADAFVEVLDERAAAGEHDAVVADIGGEFGRRAFERHADGIHDGRNAFTERFADFAVVYCDRLGYAFDQVAAFDFHGQRLVERISGADFHLDLLGGALAHQQVIFALEVVHDGLIHLVAGHAHGTRINDAAERNHRDVGGAAPDVDNHVAARLSDGQPRAD